MLRDICARRQRTDLLANQSSSQEETRCPRHGGRLAKLKPIGARGHRLCRLIWIILHRGVRYEERGSMVLTKSRRQRTSRMIRELRNLGYRVEPMDSAA